MSRAGLAASTETDPPHGPPEAMLPRRPISAARSVGVRMPSIRASSVSTGVDPNASTRSSSSMLRDRGRRSAARSTRCDAGRPRQSHRSDRGCRTRPDPKARRTCRRPLCRRGLRRRRSTGRSHRRTDRPAAGRTDRMSRIQAGRRAQPESPTPRRSRPGSRAGKRRRRARDFAPLWHARASMDARGLPSVKGVFAHASSLSHRRRRPRLGQLRPGEINAAGRESAAGQRHRRTTMPTAAPGSVVPAVMTRATWT